MTAATTNPRAPRTSRSSTKATAQTIDHIEVVVEPTVFEWEGKPCTAEEFAAHCQEHNTAPLFSNGITTKDVTCLIVASLQGFITMSICISLLATFMWMWLAIVIAFLASLYVGNKFNGWFARDGYDQCVSAVSKVGSMFRRSAPCAA